MKDEKYQPLKVTVKLRSQVMIDRWQPLDGILGATVIEDPELRERKRQAARYHFYKVNCEKWGRAETDEWYTSHVDHKTGKLKYGYIPQPIWNGHSLPLATWGHGVEHMLWVYRSSRAFPVGEYERDVVHFTKRLDWLAAQDLVKPVDRKINIGKGEFVAKYLPYQTLAVDALEWYVCGLRDEIEAILDVIYSIGKKRRRGYGFVKQWCVEPVERDLSVFTPDGELMRPVPAELLERMDVTGDFEYSFCTFRPPYWKTQFAARCAVGGYRE